MVRNFNDMTQKGHQGHLGRQNAVNPLMNDSKSNLPQKASEGALHALFTETAAKSPIIPRHPLDHENVIKFALGHSVSDALEDSGRHHLLVTAPSDATTPARLQGRRILHAVVITQQQADDLYRVACGSHRAVRIKQSPKEKP